MKKEKILSQYDLEAMTLTKKHIFFHDPTRQKFAQQKFWRGNLEKIIATEIFTVGFQAC